MGEWDSVQPLSEGNPLWVEAVDRTLTHPCRTLDPDPHVTFCLTHTKAGTSPASWVTGPFGAPGPFGCATVGRPSLQAAWGRKPDSFSSPCPTLSPTQLWCLVGCCGLVSHPSRPQKPLCPKASLDLRPCPSGLKKD